MNFLEAIEPFEDRLNAYQKLKSYSGADSNELRELINIFLKYVANPKGDMIPSMGCGNCISKMFQRLVTHREVERQKNVDIINDILQKAEKTITISSGGVEVTQIDLEDQIEEELQEAYEKEMGLGIYDNPDLSKEAKIAHLQQECKERGIKYHHKAGVKKLRELLNE